MGRLGYYCTTLDTMTHPTPFIIWVSVDCNLFSRQPSCRLSWPALPPLPLASLTTLCGTPELSQLVLLPELSPQLPSATLASPLPQPSPLPPSLSLPQSLPLPPLPPSTSTDPSACPPPTAPPSRPQPPAQSTSHPSRCPSRSTTAPRPTSPDTTPRSSSQ